MAKILIVEDEKLLNEAYELVLKRGGFDVSVAFNGEEALDIVSQTKPDLILLDLRMPKMDGVAFLQKLKPADKYPDMKIIVFSNYDEQREIDEAFKYGATRYILKAWNSPSELIKVVKETLESDSKDS
ncbi:MAG: DNA-binding response regulator VicR [Candidatus Saccharibacteria bacterium]|nr:DNA-binding response regulator VicR [Candidatus Saccharibacteria bacterium]